MDLEQLRREIDDIDKNLVAWLEKRLTAVMAVAEVKGKTGTPVLNEARERAVLQKAAGHLKNTAFAPYVEELFRAMMAQSRRMQEEKLALGHVPQPKQTADGKTVAYCGIPGSYAEEALINYFGGAETLSLDTFEEVARCVEEGRADYGILPVENSSAGAVTQVEDLLLDREVFITGETVLTVAHHLLGVPGATEEGIRKVVSHPQAIEQSMRYIRDRGLAIALAGNTAFAARDVAQGGDQTVAAIGSERAAQMYGLSILRRNIQTSPVNSTRFIVIERRPSEAGDKLGLICIIPNTPGSLYGLLEIFAKQGLNLIKLLARPIPESPWRYRFHIDISGNLRDESVRTALKQAEALCDRMKVTGSYVSGGAL